MFFLEIETTENPTGASAYCLLFYDRVVEYVFLTIDVKKFVQKWTWNLIYKIHRWLMYKHFVTNNWILINNNINT